MTHGRTDITSRPFRMTYKNVKKYNFQELAKSREGPDDGHSKAAAILNEGVTFIAYYSHII